MAKNSNKGFTLVELMVTVAIIAILSMVAIAVFTNLQKNARDTRRKQDIDAIASALEAHFGDSNCGANFSQYCAPQTSWFANNQIPPDPRNNQSDCGDSSSVDIYQKRCWYCIHADGSNGLCSQSDSAVSTTNPAIGATIWSVCANLENGNPKYYCKRSIQ